MKIIVCDFCGALLNDRMFHRDITNVKGKYKEYENGKNKIKKFNLEICNECYKRMVDFIRDNESEED